MPGPPPKRDEERRRRNKDGVATIKVNLDEVLTGEVEIPAPPTKLDEHHEDCPPECDEHTGEEVPVWHPVAEQWYRSLAQSGQALFYEPSDWSTAYLVADQISRALEPRPTVIGEDSSGEPIIRYMVVPMPGATLNAILKANSSLMASEGDRRRLRIELDRKKAQDAKLGGDGVVVSIVQEREKLFS